MLARGQAELSGEWYLRRKDQHRTHTGDFGIYEVKPMKVMLPWKKEQKIQRGWVAPKKRRKNARGESRHTPDFLRGCVGGAIRGVIFFYYPKID